MKTKKTKEPIVIEDVVWYIEDDNGKYHSIAKKTFYYQFLMEHANSEVNGQANKQTAIDFECYQRLYVYLLNQHILDDPRSNLDFTPIEGGATFTLNFTSVMEDYDNIEELLRAEFPQAVMQKYINTLLHPADGFRCSICGAYSFSRHLSFGDGKNKITYCFGCHPLHDDIQNRIKKEYDRAGTLVAVNKRLEIIEEALVPYIAPNKSIDVLLDEFRKANETDNERAREVRGMLNEKQLEEWECFGFDDVDVVLWNRKRLADINIFADCVVLTEDGEDIIAVMDKAGVVYTDEKAVNFANKLKEEC